ncbi:MAG: sugar kinase [Saprospiraceae bacterium]|nr:sugar kinase [Saprospiraceae bacterium]
MNSKTVAVIGELNVDIILDHLIGLPEVGKEKLAGSMELVLGSSAAIFASNLSKLGVKTHFIGKLGHDLYGDYIIEALTDRGINVERVVVDQVQKTGATIVLNYGQDRANITFAGAMHDLTIKDIHFETLANVDHIHISSIFMLPGIKKDLVAILKKLKDMGKTISLDPQWDPLEQWDLPLHEVLPLIDVFLPNKSEWMNLTQSPTFEIALDALKSFTQNKIVIKNGEQGAYLWSGKVLTLEDSYQNTYFIDAIGAGDSFDAGFIKTFVSGDSDQTCLNFACITGAINTMCRGGTSAFDQFNSNMEKLLIMNQSRYEG